MSTRNICRLALLGIGMIAGPAVADPATDKLLARYGLFELDDGEEKTVNRGRELKTYRICMEEGRYALPLRVLHDGQETLIAPGECQLIEAKKIRMVNTGKLAKDTVLVGRWRINNDISATERSLASARREAAGNNR